MRRHYVIRRAVARGEEQPVVLRSFVDFLFLYGHFVSNAKVGTDAERFDLTNVSTGQAGEDLDEDDDFVDLDEEAHPESAGNSGLRQRQMNRDDGEGAGERAPLLRDQTRGRSVARLKRSKSVGKTGDATVFQAVLMVRSRA
jgi:proton-coupled amino acid transporter